MENTLIFNIYGLAIALLMTVSVIMYYHFRSEIHRIGRQTDEWRETAFDCQKRFNDLTVQHDWLRRRSKKEASSYIERINAITKILKDTEGLGKEELTPLVDSLNYIEAELKANPSTLKTITGETK